MVDVLGRGWSPTERQYRLLRLAVALSLLASPALVYLSGVGRATYTYDAVPVQAEDGVITYDDDQVRYFEGFQGIDCYLESEQSRACFLDRRLADDNATFGDDSHRPETDEYYTYVDGQFYERVDTFRDGSLVLWLRPVDAAAVLGTVAGDYPNLPDPLQRAVRGDTGTAHRDLDAHGQIVWYDGSHYAIYEVSSSRASGYAPSLVAALVGLVLLSRSLRIDVRE